MLFNYGMIAFIFVILEIKVEYYQMFMMCL